LVAATARSVSDPQPDTADVPSIGSTGVYHPAHSGDPRTLNAGETYRGSHMPKGIEKDHPSAKKQTQLFRVALHGPEITTHWIFHPSCLDR
jgi:hypothetical protein